MSDTVAQRLNAAFASADSRAVTAELGAVARERGIAGIARDTGLRRENLYRALSAEKDPAFSTVMKVLTALGLHLVARSQAVAPRKSRDAPTTKTVKR